MALIVQKYGGTSVANPERIKNVARRIARFKEQGHQVVVVVSAMSGETNKLIALAKEMQPSPDPRELDAIVSTGEQVTTGLLVLSNGTGTGSGSCRIEQTSDVVSVWPARNQHSLPGWAESRCRQHLHAPNAGDIVVD